MPRMLRLEAPGSLVHIMARGIDGQTIFADSTDRRQFLARFARHRKETGYKCLAWCLMPNHYHLLLRTTEMPPGSLMRPLNGGYARWYNARHNRRGYLFQDRYKSILCQDMDYAAELIRYVHLNPIRAGLVPTLASLKQFRWCGHGLLVGAPRATGAEFQDRTEALRRFGKRPERALVGYLRFLAEGIDGAEPQLAGRLGTTEFTEAKGASKGWPAVIGDPEFARAAMERHAVARQRKHRQADYAAVLHDLAARVSAESDIPRDDLFRKARANAKSAARALFCYRARFEELIPFSVVADFLGTTVSPVVALARRHQASVGA